MTGASSPRRLSPLLLLASALVALAVFLVHDGAPPAQAQQTQTVVLELSASPNPAVEGTSVAVEACLRKGDASATPDGTLRIPVRLSHGDSEDGDWGNSLSGYSDGRRPIRTLEYISIHGSHQRSCGLVNIPIHRDSDTDNETFTAALVTADLPASVVAGATTSVEVTITDSANVVERPGPAVGSPAVGSPSVCPQSGVVGRTTMTAGRGTTTNATISGYNPSPPAQAYDPLGTLTSQRFSHDGTVYEIRLVTYVRDSHNLAGDDVLVLKLDRPHTASLVAALALHADGKVFHFEDAYRFNDGVSLRWSNAGLSWSEGQQVELCVTVARVSLSVSPAPVLEGGTATVTATLSRAVKDAVTIPVTMRDIAAQSGPDWAQSLVDDGIPIAAGQTSGSVELSVPWDEGAADETYRVVLDFENLPAAVQSSGSTSAVSINVRDHGDPRPPAQGGADPNDFITAPGLEVSATELDVSAGGSASYTVKLGAPPTDIVVVTPTVADAARASVSPSQLVFSQADWNEAQTVTVSGAAAGETSILHAVSTQDPAYCCAILPTLKVTVSATGQQGTNPHAGLIAQMVEWRNDPQWVSYKSHTDRWDRALLAFGETVADTSLTAMTQAEAQAYADANWGERWVEVAAALTALEQAAQTPEPEDLGSPPDDQDQQPQPQQLDPPPANRAPTVASALADTTIVNASGTHSASLSGVFTDADGDPLSISAASSNDAVARVSVSADGSRLTVTAGSRGTATITVTADDGNGGSVSEAFTVTVKTAPQVVSAISDISGLTVGSAQDVSLSGVFRDADGDALTISADSDDSTVADAVLFQDTLTVIGVSAGTATITVTARDADGGTVTERFTVRVKTAPEAVSSLADVNDIDVGSTRTVSLSGVFTDTDGDPLSISAASSNDAVAAVSVFADGSALTLDCASAGEATITVTARDPDGNEATASFGVRVVLPLTQEPDSTPASTLTGVAARYDANGDGKIDHDEYLQATRDYDEGVIGILDVLKVRRAYFAGQG